MKCLVRKSTTSMLDSLGINLEKIQAETDKLTGKKKKKANKTSPKNKTGKLD